MQHTESVGTHIAAKVRETGFRVDSEGRCWASTAVAANDSSPCAQPAGGNNLTPLGISGGTPLSVAAGEGFAYNGQGGNISNCQQQQQHDRSPHDRCTPKTENASSSSKYPDSLPRCCALSDDDNDNRERLGLGNARVKCQRGTSCESKEDNDVEEFNSFRRHPDCPERTTCELESRPQSQSQQRLWLQGQPNIITKANARDEACEWQSGHAGTQERRLLASDHTEKQDEWTLRYHSPQGAHSYHRT